MKTDAEIQVDVIDEMKWDPSIKAAQIGVQVSDGIVTLSGHVGSFAEKWNAEHVAQRVAGVKAMTVEIEVKPTDTSKRSDVDIARSAEDILSWTAGLPKESIKVLVENGWVILSGTVTWGYQRDAAVGAIRCLNGVTGVSNDIAIKPKVTLSAVKSDVEAALNRRARAHAQNISVKVNNDEVTLSGTVDSWLERELAAHSAWGAPGVRSVVDNLIIA